MRTLYVSEQTGVVALLVHALSESAKQFYVSCGFIELPINPMTLCLSCKTAQQALGDMTEQD